MWYLKHVLELATASNSSRIRSVRPSVLRLTQRRCGVGRVRSPGGSTYFLFPRVLRAMRRIEINSSKSKQARGFDDVTCESTILWRYRNVHILQSSTAVRTKSSPRGDNRQALTYHRSVSSLCFTTFIS